MAQTKAPAKRKTATKKRATRKAAPKAPEAQFTDEQWAALVNTYVSLRDAGLPIPDEIATPVNQWLADEQAKADAEAAKQRAEAKASAEDDATGPKWVRNTYHAPFSLRLQRQDKKERIDLQPRGQRGDMFPLSPGDETDHILINNLQLGVIELIGHGEATRIAKNQTTNIKKGNTTLALIRNERDEPIEKLVVETEYNKQGVVVGYVDPNAAKAAPLGGIVRPNQAEQVRQFVPTGGNPAIVSSGFAPAVSKNAQAKIADDLARRKGAQGRPEDVLGLQVSVTPAQKT